MTVLDRQLDKATVAFKNAKLVKSLRRKSYWTRVGLKWCKRAKSAPQIFIDAICAPLRQTYYDEESTKGIFEVTYIGDSVPSGMINLDDIKFKEDNFLGSKGHNPSLSQIYNGLGVDLNYKPINKELTDFEMIAFT